MAVTQGIYAGTRIKTCKKAVNKEKVAFPVCV